MMVPEGTSYEISARSAARGRPMRCLLAQPSGHHAHLPIRASEAYARYATRAKNYSISHEGHYPQSFPIWIARTHRIPCRKGCGRPGTNLSIFKAADGSVLDHAALRRATPAQERRPVKLGAGFKFEKSSLS